MKQTKRKRRRKNRSCCGDCCLYHGVYESVYPHGDCCYVSVDGWTKKKRMDHPVHVHVNYDD